MQHLLNINMYLNSFKSFLDSKDISYAENENLSSYTSFRIGGPAAILAEPDCIQKLSDLMKYLKQENIKTFILGKGSNLLVSDDGFDGCVVRLKGDFETIELTDECTIKTGAGAKLIALCNFALENSLSGLEFAYGIPGTVGGAVYMNAGAYGGETADVILSASHINMEGEAGSYDKNELDLSYRHSIYSSDDAVITGAVFKLQKAEKSVIKEKMLDLMGRRKDKQPLEYPSAGSTFKRPEGYFAGALIEQSNLKGYSVGGAQVSEKHAGFVINKDNATCNDVLNLISHCQDVVREKFGVELETEVKIVK